MTAVTTYQGRLAKLRTATTGHALAAWDALPDYNIDRAAPFAVKVAPIIGTGQLLTARNTAAYLSRKLGGPPPRILPADVTDLRQGVPTAQAYQRPFGLVWHALGKGLALDAAVAIGRGRLADMVATDVLLAMKAATSIVGGTDNRITGWVRVADSGACDLCQAADGETYSDASDMGIHPSCGCTLDPAFDGTQSAPEDEGATATHESAELGPLLYEAGHSFAE